MQETAEIAGGLQGSIFKNASVLPQDYPSHNNKFLQIFKSVQTRCIVKKAKGLRKVRFSGDFLGVSDFLRIACSLGIPQKKTFKFNKIPDFYERPFVFTMHLVCTL